MVDIDRIKEVAKKKGIKLSYITDKLELKPVYFNDVKRHNRDIPEDRLTVIADILRTTTAYLRDETDEPRRPEDIPPENPQPDDIVLFRGGKPLILTPRLKKLLVDAIELLDKEDEEKNNKKP